MNAFLNNPVYQALCTGDAHLSEGSSTVKYFDEAVSPFAGFSEEYPNGFEELYQLLPAGRKILYATRHKIKEFKRWQLAHEIKGLQFVFENTGTDKFNIQGNVPVIPLSVNHVPEMMQLATLTRPGPFNERTIEFGYYHGIFENERLAAMTGQRLHPGNYAELSAICTHPDFLGKGYATILTYHQLNLILSQNKIPFLHVRADNERAIAIYERLGFVKSGVMNFYFLKKS